MALQKKLTKEQFSKLPEHFKTEYIEDGDGYRLDLQGEEDTGALKRAKDREVELRRQAEAKLRETQEQLDSLGSDDARKKGDIATLEKSWQKKMEDQKSEFESKLNKLTTHTKTQLVDNVALQIASKISNAPNVILPHIKARLAADFEADSPITRILDKDGKPSAMTLEELSNEFVANKDFSAIIVASKASGGAGKPANNNGGSAPNQSDKPADFASMNPAQLAEHIKASKAND
jgi:hypothetical protein